MCISWMNKGLTLSTMHGATMKIHIFCYKSSVEIFPDVCEKRVRTKSRILLEIITKIYSKLKFFKHPDRTPGKTSVIICVL